MAKHTPGKWMIRKIQEHSLSYVIQTDDSGIVGEVFENRYCKKIITPEQTIANAHLIASAPELLEACKRIVERPGVPPLETDLIFAKQAIAKAEGKL